MSSSSPKFISNLNIIQNEKNKSNITVNSYNYQSIVKNMPIGLTAYESVCSPRTIENELNVSFTKDQVNKLIEEVLRCTICYNLFQNPVSVKGCLHKFCKSCISDYYFRIKKECAICRHPIETKRLLKEDNKIKEIIECFIPDQNKFKDEEDKLLSLKAKEYVFKDEQKHMMQFEKNKNNENKEKNKENNLDDSKSSNNINDINYNNKNINNNNLLNKKTKRDNHSHNNNHNNKGNNNNNNNNEINNKIDNDINNNNININEQENKNSEIIIRILCDEKDSGLQKYFKYTRMKVETSYTLEFVSRFICYKQNFKYDQIKKINFYTMDNLKKKEWHQSDKICDVVDYDSKVDKSSDEMENKDKESFYSHLYHLYLYFYIN